MTHWVGWQHRNVAFLNYKYNQKDEKCMNYKNIYLVRHFQKRDISLRFLLMETIFML